MNQKKRKKKSQSNQPSIGDESLTYHEYSTTDQTIRLPGKIEVNPSKSCLTQRDLSLAYTPGVARPTREISKDQRKVSDYTSRSNLVAVVTNGTAVLGLGNVGPYAAKPVMEGKGVLFKRFANVNVFDIELNAPSPDEVVKACEMLEPTVGGINLEDIRSPDCFEVEERLRKSLKIPVFHDDQHGTAVILLAALLNALSVAKKKASKIKVVFSGAGAAAISCARLIQKAGIKKSQIIMCDKEGVLHTGRKNLDAYKSEFAKNTKLRSLREAIKGADVFIGLSAGGVMDQTMLKSMAKKPIIFALANPDPEIPYDEAKVACKEAIVATGRSDYPNQINNVLGFPYIFRGALDVEASEINDEMKLAAANALAKLAKQDVPETVSKAYEGEHFRFGPDYLIPKPFDTRALYWVAPAVAQAAMESNVAHRHIDIQQYREELFRSIDRSRQLLSTAVYKAKRQLRKIVFPEGKLVKIQQAARILAQEEIAQPILLGKQSEMKQVAESFGIDLSKVELLEPETHPKRKDFAERFYQLRQRKGMSPTEAYRHMQRGTYFGLSMVREGMADALVSGLEKSYPETIRPALQLVKMKKRFQYAAGLYIMLLRDRVLFFADTTVNIDPSAHCLAEIAIQTAERAEFFDITPRIALLSFSNFGSAPHPMNDRVQEALRLIQERRPDLIIDGEMQADTAVTPELLARYPFSELKEPANVLIFPQLSSGNISYKFLQRLGNADVIGPILMGPEKPIHVLQEGASVDEIINMATIAAAEANDG